MKHIDADKLQAEIERLAKRADRRTDKDHASHNAEMERYGEDYWNGYGDLAYALLSFLDTLSEEPVPKGYDEAYLNEKIAKASKTWEGVDVDKYIDEVRGREPDKGLDVTDFCKPIDPGIAQCVADHWWELLGDKEPDKSLEEAAEKRAIEYAEREKPKDADGEIWKVGDVMIENRMSFEDGFKAGAEWQKSQMLKDAVEGYVGMHLTDKGTKVTVNSGYLPEEMEIKGDSKVRIIIVKED